MRWSVNRNPPCRCDGWMEEYLLVGPDARAVVSVGLSRAPGLEGKLMLAVDFRSSDGSREYLHVSYQSGGRHPIQLRPARVMMDMLMDFIDRNGPEMPRNMYQVLSSIHREVSRGEGIITLTVEDQEVLDFAAMLDSPTEWAEFLRNNPRPGVH